MRTRSLFPTALIAFFAFALTACGAMDDTPTYRYRLTVEVDTPEGPRSGSSVIEVDTRAVRPGSNPAGTGVEIRARGEAVAVDLPGGQTLFALLRSESDVDWAGRVMLQLAPQTNEPFIEQFDNMMELRGRGPIALPRMWPPAGFLEERRAYPMLVTFGDLDDPTSVTLVDPDDLAASFGEGISIIRITAEMTTADVTTGIEERLGWLGPFGREHGALRPSGSRYLDEAKTVNLIAPSDFITELYE